MFQVIYSDEKNGFSQRVFSDYLDAEKFAKDLLALCVNERPDIADLSWDGEKSFGYSVETGIWSVIMYAKCSYDGCDNYIPLGGITVLERDEETGVMVPVTYSSCGYCD